MKTVFQVTVCNSFDLNDKNKKADNNCKKIQTLVMHQIGTFFDKTGFILKSPLRGLHNKSNLQNRTLHTGFIKLGNTERAVLTEL